MQPAAMETQALEAVISYVFQMLMITPVGLIAAYVIVGMTVEISQTCWRKLWRRL